MKIPLSKIQEQFWVLGNLYPNTSAYTIPLVYKLSGKLCVHSLKEALSSNLNRHALLSASIDVEDNSPFFHIPARIDINDYFEDHYLNFNFSNEGFQKYILTEVHRSFKLDEDFLTRVRYISFADTAFLVFIFHHIVIDHRSKYIFLSDISEYYSSFIKKRPTNLTSSTVGYESYIKYEQKFLLSDKADKMRMDWRSTFEKHIPQIDLPFDGNSDKTFKSQGQRLLFSLYSEVSEQIDNFSTQNNINPFVFLLATYALFLSRIGEQTTISIGVPLSNRRNETFKNTVGCFVNVLPLIVSLDKNTTFTEILKQVRTGLLKNHRRQEIPFVELQSLYNENQKGYPFYVGFTFEEPVDFILENIETKPQNIEREGSQLELFLTLWSSDKGYQGFWEFNTDKFNDATIHRFMEIFRTIIQEVLPYPGKNYLDYPILPDSNKQLIESINNTKCRYNEKICIHQVFEKKVAEIPDHTALFHNDIHLTYKELNVHANRLANYLIDNNTQVGDIIAIACERRVEMIISILATLKAGAAYLPLPIGSPPEVILEVIDDAKPKFIISSLFGSSNIRNKHQILSIEDILQNPFSIKTNNPETKVKSKNLAYIIYTSGSTGTPKGVAVKHNSVINRIEWMQKSYPLNESDVLMQKTPITFDVSVWELFWWFFGGAKLALLVPDGEKDPMLIIESIKEYGITKIHFVPSMFTFFINTLRKQNLTDQISSLQTLFCSGESLPASMVKAFYCLESSFPLAKIVNLYGPTEATVDVSYYNCPKYMKETDKIFIGRPIDNTELYIVNANLKVQPIGIKGELLICGTNLAAGYINNKALSNKLFIPFNKPNGEQVVAYKTGDIAILNENGEIEYVGRKDNQVKIRGIRIELGEIESKIMKHAKITSAAVSLVSEHENKTIIAYVVLSTPNAISERRLLNDFKKILPATMVPSQILFMDQMPLTSSGKTDRKKLPKPHKRILAKTEITPETIYENELFALWNKLLSAENIQITDNFYDIGGNSLLAIELSMLIAETFSIEPDVISVMEYPTIKDYALYLENKIKFRRNSNISFTTKKNSRSESMRRRFAQNRNRLQ